MRRMDLLSFKRTLTKEAWEQFARDCGTSPGHLRNVAYGTAKANAALTRQVYEQSHGAVPVWELRPSDWHTTWPELASMPGAPVVEREAA